MDPQVSFEAHLSGGVMGLVLALYYPASHPQREEIDLDADVDDTDPYWETDYPHTEEDAQAEDETS